MTVMYYPGRRPVQPDMPDGRRHRQEIARAVNQLISGHNNATLQVTLTPNAGSTTVINAEISTQTAPIIAPLTAHAAAEIAAGTMYFTPSQGQLVITHANNAEADRTFNMALIG